jgi:hypothetical protein
MNSRIRFTPTAVLTAAIAFAAPHAGAAAKRAPVDSVTRTQAGTPVQPGVPSKPDNTTSTGRELTGPGAHPEEYKAAAVTGSSPAPVVHDKGATPAAVGKTPVQPGVPSKPNNTTSTGRELTGPGAQPEEYKAAGAKAPIVYDTVHNVRVKPDTTTATGRAWRDSVRGTTGPTRPGGGAPRPNTPRTPMEMPGSGGADPSVPGSGPAR